MSVTGATDAMAQEYLLLSKEKEGGVYVALSGIDTETMEKKLLALGIEHKTERGKSWNYITFPRESGLAVFFFIEGHIVVNDLVELLTHKNGSDQIAAVWLDGGQQVIDFLKGIGLQYSGRVTDSQPGAGETFLTDTGKIIVTSQKVLHSRPRVNAVSFSNKQGRELALVVF